MHRSCLCTSPGLPRSYRGVPLITKRWMLASVRGESSSTQLPAHPSPSFTPEAVVEAQLQAVRWVYLRGRSPFGCSA